MNDKPAILRSIAHTLLSGWCVAAGCARQPASSLSAGELRLVSTSPALTECVYAIGAGEALVGRSSACDYPPEVVDKAPVVGDYAYPWLEPLLARNPTHVLVDYLPDDSLGEKLRRLGVKVVHLPCSRLDDIAVALHDLGRLTGCEERADALSAQLRRQILQARRRAEPKTTPPRVLVLCSLDPLITAGRNSFVAELVSLAGGANMGDGIEAEYAHISLEWVAEEDPDVVVCLFDAPDRSPVRLLAERIGWREVRAVRENAVFRVPELGSVARPGPRVMQGVEQLRAIIDGVKNTL